MSNKKTKQKMATILHLPSLNNETAAKRIASTNKQILDNEKKICEMAAKTILKALDCKDAYTYGHSMRVAYFAISLGKEMGLTEEELYDLELSALFHDIGKIGVPDSVLLKPSRLTEDEFLAMKSHPSKSYEILKEFTHFEKVATYAKHHHERYDGRGYPDGLKGEDIPLFSRIILIADTFDAMTSSRPYRKGLEYDVAFAELLEFSDSQFDGKLVKHFISAMTKESKKNEDTFTLSIIDGVFQKDAA